MIKDDKDKRMIRTKDDKDKQIETISTDGEQSARRTKDNTESGEERSNIMYTVHFSGSVTEVSNASYFHRMQIEQQEAIEEVLITCYFY